MGCGLVRRQKDFSKVSAEAALLKKAASLIQSIFLSRNMQHTRGTQHASGVWVGQVLGGQRARPALWCLTLIADAPAPSAYGASVAHDGSLLFLHGDWTAASRSLRLIERGRNTNRVYMATLQEDPSGILSFQGTWRDSNTGESGQFAACKEPDNIGTYISGLWLGQAVPDASLADFMIPTNPIRWSLALLQKAPGGVPSVFGMGYFDDSGDIPNKPLLYFTLRGEWNPETRKVQFLKEYESAAETDGYEVKYEGACVCVCCVSVVYCSGGTLESEPTAVGSEGSQADALWLKGTWRNEKGGSFGQFSARRQKAFEAAVAAICLCEVRVYSLSHVSGLAELPQPDMRTTDQAWRAPLDVSHLPLVLVLLRQLCTAGACTYTNTVKNNSPCHVGARAFAHARGSARASHCARCMLRSDRGRCT